MDTAVLYSVDIERLAYVTPTYCTVPGSVVLFRLWISGVDGGIGQLVGVPIEVLPPYVTVDVYE